MHASTRILLLLVAAVAIVAGWWVLLAINSVAVETAYNRFTARRRGDAPSGGSGPATGLAELSDLRDRGLITPEECDAKRARIIERL